MVVPYAVVSFPVTAEAQAQPTVSSASVIVLPVLDPDGLVDSVLSGKATDSLALAMQGSRQFMVTSSMDLQRELKQLDMRPPLSDLEQVRLGDRLAVDQVATGQITHLRVNQKTGQVDIGLAVAVLDVHTGEYFNGANVSATTKKIPGWHGEEARVINDALREVSTVVVEDILTNRVDEGIVTSVNNFGVATINLGHDDRIQSGMEMLLLRPVWQRDLEEMIMVKVGRYHVTEVSARSAKIMPLHWSILCTDLEYVHSIPLYDLGGRNFGAFCLNPIDGFQPEFLRIRSGTIFPSANWTAPQMSDKDLLVVPLGDYARAAVGGRKRGPICAIFSASKVEVYKPIGDIWGDT